MITFCSDVRIFMHTGPIDMRKSYDGLYGIVSSDFQRDVREGGLFLFLNRRRDRVKLLWFESGGLVIWMKRLEVGTFHRPVCDANAKQVVLTAAELHMLISGIDLVHTRQRRRYTRPSSNEAESTPVSSS